MSDDEDVERPLWPLAAVAVVVVIWCLASLGGLSAVTAPLIRIGFMPEVIGILLGHAILKALAVSVVLLVFLWRSPRYSPTMSHFAVAFVVALAVNGGALFLLDRVASAQNAETKAVLESVVASALNGKPLDTGTKLEGDAGVVERLLKKFAAQSVAFGSRYRAEMASLGIPERLTLSDFSGDLPGVRSRLKAGHVVVEKFRQEHISMIRDSRDAMEKAPFNETLKPAMLKSFDDAIARTGDTMPKFLALEDGILMEYERLADDLGRARPWYVKDDAAVFSSDSDLTTFNAHIAALRDLEEKRSALVSASHEAVKKKVGAPHS